MNNTKVLLTCGAIVLGLVLTALEGLTGYDKQPFGSGLVSQLVVSAPLSTQEVKEVTPHSIESAVIDCSNNVFVIHYYIPSHPKTIEQNKLLERLNAHFDGEVTFLKIDVTKHYENPVCGGIYEPSVVAFGLERSSADRNQIVDFYHDTDTPGSDAKAILSRIHACKSQVQDSTEEPSISQDGWLNSDGSDLSTRGVPYWSWDGIEPQSTLKDIAEQQ